LLAAFSASVLAGSLASGLVRRRYGARAIILAEQYTGLAVIAFLIRPSVWVLAIAILPQAFVLPVTDTVVVSRRIALTPDRLLGRVEAVRLTIARTAAPLGPLAAGLLAGTVSNRAAIALFAVFAVVLAVWATASRSLD
jgi:hypothetical protein